MTEDQNKELLEGFTEVLENDPESVEWRNKCHYHFDELCKAHTEGIIRTRALMAIHSENEVGGDGTDDDLKKDMEIPLMVRGICEDFRGEMACRMMDILDPDWINKAKELLMMAKLQEMLQGLEGFDPSSISIN